MNVRSVGTLLVLMVAMVLGIKGLQVLRGFLESRYDIHIPSIVYVLVVGGYSGALIGCAVHQLRRREPPDS
jgi:hypothetical protein